MTTTETVDILHVHGIGLLTRTASLILNLQPDEALQVLFNPVLSFIHTRLAGPDIGRGSRVHR